MAVPDVDRPRTWSARLQWEFWRATGRAQSIRGQYKAPPFGDSVTWLDPAARDYWGRVVGDPNIYPTGQ